MENSNIEWTDHTWNPWIGCTKVSPACKNCYAEELMDNRYGKVAWGPSGTRALTSDSYWKQPIKWNKAASLLPDKVVKPYSQPIEYMPVGRPRVFCASLADVFEDWQGPILNHKGEQLYRGWHHSQPEWVASSVPCEGEPITMQDVRQRLFELIDATPHLDWLILTKRPENIQKMWPGRKDNALSPFPKKRYNVWLGTSVENQEFAETRIPELLNCRDLSPVLFLSCEPLLDQLDLTNIRGGNYNLDALRGQLRGTITRDIKFADKVDWIICGGESGKGARSMDIEWARSLKDQCQSTGVAFFMKQLSQADTKDYKDLDKFPEDLRVREFPLASP